HDPGAVERGAWRDIRHGRRTQSKRYFRSATGPGWGAKMHLGQDAAIRAVMGRLPRFAWLLSSCLLCLPSNAAAQTRPPAGGSAEAPRKPAPTKARQPAKPKKPRSARTVKAQ